VIRSRDFKRISLTMKRLCPPEDLAQTDIVIDYEIENEGRED